MTSTNHINHLNYTPLNIVILAAGMGKRMYSERPKVLHPIAGQAMLNHVLETSLALKPATLTVVVGHQAHLVEAALAEFSQKRTDLFSDLPFQSIKTALQTEQKGTGHALAQALPHLDVQVPTLVLYGDVPLMSAETLKNFISERKNLENLENLENLKQSDAVSFFGKSIDKRIGILTAIYPNPTGYGRIIKDDKSLVTAIVEEKDANPTQKQIQEINTGIMLLPTQALTQWLHELKPNNAQGEYYLTDVVAKAHQENYGIYTTWPQKGIWETYGVNNKVQLAELERIHQQQKAQSLLEQGVMLYDPARIDIRGTLTCEMDVEIDVDCIFIGHVHLGKGVKIGAHSILEDVSIGAGSTIKAFSHLEKAIIGKNCQIGPYARLRPGSELAEDCHIGNFVELKNAKLAAHSKANHLSYLGDAQIGQNVNIGAGVITCNYDGANKHQTVIEDDVFVGSDCQLIAPITLGKGSTIAAGTTLSKNAPAEQLTLSKRQQISIEGWQRPKKKAKN